jgi:hypothetical protein
MGGQRNSGGGGEFCEGGHNDYMPLSETVIAYRFLCRVLPGVAECSGQAFCHHIVKVADGFE